MLVHNGYALNSYNGYQNLCYIKVSSGNFRERGDHNIQRTDCLSKYFSFKTNEPAQMKKKKKKTYAKQSFMASASEDDVLVHLVYDRFSRLRLSRSLDKPSPKLLGKDKPWLELAVTAYFVPFIRSVRVL